MSEQDEQSSYPVPVITVDGPSGSGKGAISRALAAELDWHYLDSGSLYRLLAFAALREGVALDDEQTLVELAGRLSDRCSMPATETAAIMLDGEEVSAELRTESAGDAASQLAVLPAVRSALLDWQRRCRQLPGLVADGRDMGTVVFPDAGLKLFLTARPEVRAERRYNQLINLGKKADLATLVEEVKARDERDSNRRTSPLRPAEDAVHLDSSDTDEATTLAKVLEMVRERL